MEQRSTLPDVIRGSLIILVVWGHLLEGRGFNENVYFAIYTFHIPAFAMISGFFSATDYSKDYFVKLFTRLAIPLAIFHVLYFIALGYFAPQRLHGFDAPTWLVWFLFSLLIWKLALPLVLRFPYPFFLSLSAALLAGFVDDIGMKFGLSRTIVFFPAFLFGHLYRQTIFDVVNRYRVPLSVVFIMMVCGAYFSADYVNIRWLWGSRPYSVIPAEIAGFAWRAAVIAAGIVMSVAFFAVVPARSESLAWLGRKTMPVFLLHGFLVMVYWNIGYQPENSLLFAVLTACVALVMTLSIAWATEFRPLSFRHSGAAQRNPESGAGTGQKRTLTPAIPSETTHLWMPDR